MSADFTILLNEPIGFGDDPAFLRRLRPGLARAGVTNDDIDFRCPNIDSDQSALMILKSQAVSFNTHVFSINGRGVPGGIPVSPTKRGIHLDMIVLPRRLLLADNELRIEARNSAGGGGGNLDSFILYEIVIMYKLL